MLWISWLTQKFDTEFVYFIYLKPRCSAVKSLPANVGTTEDMIQSESGRSPGGQNGNPLQYSCLEIPWTEEPSRLLSLVSQRVRHHWSCNAQYTVGKANLRWLDSITDTMDISLSKLQEILKDRKPDVLQSTQRVGHDLAAKQQQQICGNRTMAIRNNTIYLVFQTKLFFSFLYSQKSS